MKQGSNQAIRFFVMESLRDWYKGGDRDKPVPKYIVGLFGGIAGKRTAVIMWFMNPEIVV
jgi:solute carrier family 25 (mitochondrial citrate transporter), member 1